MQISIVVPLYNEEESINELFEWIKRVMTDNKLSYQVIFVDDGSNDSSWKVVSKLVSENDNVIGVKFRRNYGKSAALNEGFKVASGDVVFTMDADLQDSPDEVPEMYRMITEDGWDIVSGWKKKRYDPFIKRVTSKFYNRVTRRMSGINLHDFNCGLKAYKLDVVKEIEVYGEMHRYIPLIAKKAGFSKITEKAVHHQARKYGVTKFGIDRFINGFLDLITITFINKYGKNPMHIFGALGAFVFIVGLIIFIVLIIEKFVYDVYGMTNRPMFYFGLLCMILGFQLFSTGFVGEMIARNSSDRNVYHVEKVIGSPNNN